MKNMSSGFLSIFIIITAALTLAAHDLWLVPLTYRANPGVPVTVSANTGMDFPNSLSAVTPDRVNQFMLAGKSTKENIADFKVKGNSLVAEYTFEKSGTYVIGMALKPKEIKLTAEEFNEYLLHDGLPHIYELRKNEGILDKGAVEHYSKYPKTIIQVGKKKDDTPTKSLGFPVEIIPKINPYTLKLGDDLEVTVIFKGKPLSDAEIA